MALQKLDLGLTSAPAAACCGGDACGIPASGTATVLAELDVDGMTCAHCVGAVTTELTALDGVDEVAVALTPGGTSRVTVRGTGPLSAEAARAAIAEAGYTLAG